LVVFVTPRFEIIYLIFFYKWSAFPTYLLGCCGRDRMVVGFTTTHAISAYHQ